MSLLPQLTNLGKLEIIEVYEYYDTPCLFGCQNLSGAEFLQNFPQNSFHNVVRSIPVFIIKFASIFKGDSLIEIRSSKTS